MPSLNLEHCSVICRILPCMGSSYTLVRKRICKWTNDRWYRLVCHLLLPMCARGVCIFLHSQSILSPLFWSGKYWVLLSAPWHTAHTAASELCSTWRITHICTVCCRRRTGDSDQRHTSHWSHWVWMNGSAYYSCDHNVSVGFHGPLQAGKISQCCQMIWRHCEIMNWVLFLELKPANNQIKVLVCIQPFWLFIFLDLFKWCHCEIWSQY